VDIVRPSGSPNADHTGEPPPLLVNVYEYGVPTLALGRIDGPSMPIGEILREKKNVLEAAPEVAVTWKK
jgi:hypothetical protein